MDSPDAADRQLQVILDAGETLVRFTELGERCEELLPSLRRFAVGNDVVFHRPIGQGIEVVRVLAGVRDIEAQF